MNQGKNLPERTLGDGMEKKPLETIDNKLHLLKNLTQHSKEITFKQMLLSMKPVEPGAEVVNLVPKYLLQDKKVSNIVVLKPKEPKFIPYEPYKGAVQRIRPQKTKKKMHVVKTHAVPEVAVETKKSKNNVEIQELVKQISDIKASELTKMKISALKEDAVMPREQWEKEKKEYETDIKNFKETIAHLENQVKFQIQVNNELKTLLVAAVGEDLESRVQHLTEDKLSLARALLNSANHLTSHQEQTEWLSGQCEVWRSKFLASSLMVEELATWKSTLTKRTHSLQDIIKSMLNEHTVLRKQMFETFKNLNQISANKRSNLKSGDLMELGRTNLDLSVELRSEYSKSLDAADMEHAYVSNQTPAEKLALKVLQNPLTITSSQDLLCNVLVGAAHSISGDQKYLQSTSLHPCCHHCTGEVQNI
ncbi:golgin-45 isoform X2 [Anthonomus grandis grandis]|uniref:golgin-45 isoform X2 n=1 Tax=Anthonomus grandis grandis TaxID=2921223 RepID=UPI0021660E88|nr:golgin-45 isoform X2 [Anthonomus grandis grandis]